MSDTSLNKFLGQGDDAVEGAFTPDPPTTAAEPQPLVLFLNTESAPVLKYWDGDSFEDVAGLVNLASGVTGDLPFANLTQIAGLSVLGVTGSSTADVAAITAGTDGQVLTRVSSSSLAFASPAMVKIEEQTPSGTGTLTFSSLGAFTHLEIRYVARSTQSATSEDMALRFNGDTAGNYDTAVFYNASATTVAAAEGLAATSASAGNLPAANATAGRAGTGVIRINDYRGTTFTKQVTAENGNFVGTSTGNWSIRVWIPHWRSTAAITSITLLLGAGNYVAGSKFSLYGIT